MIGTLKRLLGRTRPGGSETSPPGPAQDDGEAQRWYVESARHLAAGRLTEAEEAIARSLGCRHDHAEALLLQGIVFKQQGRLDDANDSLLLAAHFKTGLAEAQFELGLIASSQGRAAEAERHFRNAVEADPRHSKAHNALGAVLFRSGSLEAAAESFRQALAVNPDYAQAHSNLGCVLVTHLDRWEEGEKHLETAWRLEPGDPAVLCNRALQMQQGGRLPEAYALWTQILESGDDVEKARLNRALILLAQGDFARGWAEYEARKRTESEYRPRNFPYPEWRNEPLVGRTILVHSEQGIGDQIMFASCIPDLLRHGGRCVLECASKLEALFRRSFPDVTVVGADGVAADKDWAARAPAIDYDVALGSLPLRFRNTPGDFPAHDGYLRADPVKVAAWKARLAALGGGRKVGISWRGGMKRTRQSLRSLPLAEWLPILSSGETRFVSLQYTECSAELADLEQRHGVRVHHWQEAIDDYDETAALVTALDLVISVQTSIVHLGGALGRPIWAMVPAVPEWRYLQGGERMPWYPSVRLWRQTKSGDWETVIARIGRALREFEQQH